MHTFKNMFSIFYYEPLDHEVMYEGEMGGTYLDWYVVYILINKLIRIELGLG